MASTQPKYSCEFTKPRWSWRRALLIGRVPPCIGKISA